MSFNIFLHMCFSEMDVLRDKAVKNVCLMDNFFHTISDI